MLQDVHYYRVFLADKILMCYVCALSIYNQSYIEYYLTAPSRVLPHKKMKTEEGEEYRHDKEKPGLLWPRR